MPESFLSDKSLWLNLQLHSDMEKKMLFEIQNDKEVSRIYMELKAGFFAFIHVTIPTFSHEECEEIYNDSFMALCENISSGKLQTLTCSLQTYINQIGRNKSVSYLRKKDKTQPFPDYEISLWNEKSDIMDDDEDLIYKEKQETIYQIVKSMENEKCRILLFSYYWHHYSMQMLTELINAKSIDVAMVTISRCRAKLRNLVNTIFRKKGFI